MLNNKKIALSRYKIINTLALDQITFAMISSPPHLLVKSNDDDNNRNNDNDTFKTQQQ